MARSSYAWLSQVEPELKAINQNATAAEVVAGRAYITDIALPSVTSRIDQLTGQTFMPLIDTRVFDATQTYIDWYRNQLMLDMPLLSASSVAVAGQALTAWTDGIYANRPNYDFTLYPYGSTPATALQGLKTSQVWQPSQYSSVSGMGMQLGSISVVGTWGYRSRYLTDAWKLSGDSVQDALGINASVTTITVTSVTGAQYDGSTPRFSPCQLIQLETEWCEVVAVDTTAHTLTVIRGARGSTAAAHVINTPISIYYPEPDIVRCAIRWCSYLYQRRAVYESVSIQLGSAGQYSAVMPMDVPEECQNILRQYTNIQSRRV